MEATLPAYGKTRICLSVAGLVFRESATSFMRNKGFDMCAALSSYGFLALIPLLFFIAYLLGNHVVSSQAALKGIEALATHMFPPLSSTVMHEIFFLMKQKTSWGIFSLLMLLVSIIPFMDQLRSAFFGIFRSHQDIPFLRSQFLNIVALVVSLALFAFLVAGELLFAFFRDSVAPGASPLAEVLDVGTAFLMLAIIVLAFYRVFIPGRVTARHLVLTSLAAAAFLLCFETFFSLFLASHPEYGISFGSLKAIGIIIFWVYCSFVVLLFAAEVMVSVDKIDALLLKKLFLSKHPALSVSRGLLGKFVSTYHEGDVILPEGARLNTLFYVLAGTVTITKKDHPLVTMQNGDYFGEMSMLLDTPSTAAAIASAPTVEVVRTSRDNFDIILRENPAIVMSVLKEMAARLKATSEQVV
jgi:membrane protein